MSDCEMGDSAPAEDCSCAPDTSMDCSSSVEPPSYESCVADTTYTSRYSLNRCSISEDEPAASSVEEIDQNALVIDDILYDTALSDPFLDVIPEPEHRRHRDVSTFALYTPRRSYKPSSMMNRSITSRANVSRNGVLTMTRLRKTEDPISAVETDDYICRMFTYVIAFIIFFVVVVVSYNYVKGIRHRSPFLNGGG